MDKKTLSFGFSKVKDQKKLQTSAIRGDERETVDETEYVTSLEDKAVKSSKPKVEDKPLVIPLIHANKWHLPTPKEIENDTDVKSNDDNSGKPELFTKTGDDITDQAVHELVAEANIQHASWEERGGTKDPNRAIPLLMQNKIPEGYETDDKLDVSLRPDEAADADYDEVPIEQYGMALLRGMGFQEKRGIGKNNKVVAPIVAVARPKGLGLGADRSLNLQQKDVGQSNNKDQQNENLVMKKGAHCVVCAGKSDGLYGIIEGLDEDNSRVVIKTAIGGNILTLNQMAVKLVTRKDFDRNSKYLNKSKVDKYKEDEAKKDRQHKSHSNNEEDHHRRKDHHRHTHKKHHKDQHRGRDSEAGSSDNEYHRHRERKSHHKDRGESPQYEGSTATHRMKDRHRTSNQSREEKSHRADRSRSPVARYTVSNSKPTKTSVNEESKVKNDSWHSLWLQPQLRVRVIDPEYKKGKYYKSKVVIEDVVSFDSCICRTDEGKILEGLSQKHLETVIPKTKPSRVMVVSGKHKGKVGEILERDSSSCVAVLQILPDCDEILTLDYDLICEYIGNVDVLSY